MNRLIKTLAVSAVIALQACAGVHYFYKNPETAEQYCMNAYLMKNYHELRDWGYITDQEYEVIIDERYFVGMSECAVYALFGPPIDANTTRTAYGLSKQLIYGDRYPVAGTQMYNYYIYIDDGKLSATQF